MSDTDAKSDAGTSVPLLDLKAQYQSIREPIEAAIRDVLESQQFILGPQVGELEQKIADYSQTKYAVGVSSGTDALLVALMALGVGPGDEVITSTYTFAATAGVIVRLGARPVFCDIEPDTYNIDPKAVAAFLENNCRAENGKVTNATTGGTVKVLMPVHLFGQMADMAALGEIADDYRLPVVEDAAQAIGAETPAGQRAGSVGTIGCFSFFPSKNLGAFGDAGMCVTKSEELAEKMRLIRVHGIGTNGHLVLIGGNFRLDAIQAVVLNVKLRYLDEWTRARQKNALEYDRLFDFRSLPLKTPAVAPQVRHIYNQYVVESLDRTALLAFLKKKRIGTAVYYHLPLHLQPQYRHSQRRCPVAERVAETIFSLPVSPEVTRLQQEYVVDSVAEFFR